MKLHNESNNKEQQQLIEISKEREINNFIQNNTNNLTQHDIPNTNNQMNNLINNPMNNPMNNLINNQMNNQMNSQNAYLDVLQRVNPFFNQWLGINDLRNYNKR